MSPLIFVLYMDYLTRILNYIGDLQEFKFFTGCASLKLNHLCFADDLLIFCKGKQSLLTCYCKGFNCFLNLLRANKSKSALYHTAMEDREITRI